MSPNARAELVVSCYLYSVAVLSAVTVVSPLIVFSLPLLVVFGWPAFSWWRHRSDREAVGNKQLIWVIVASLFLTGGLLYGAAWLRWSSWRGKSDAVLVAGIALCFVPLPIATSQVLRVRGRGTSGAS